MTGDQATGTAAGAIEAGAQPRPVLDPVPRLQAVVLAVQGNGRAVVPVARVPGTDASPDVPGTVDATGPVAVLAQPAAQERLAVLELGPWFPRAGAGQERAVAHHRHRFGRQAAPGERHLPQRRVDREHLVRRPVAAPLQPAQRPVHGPAAAMPQLVQLGGQVPLVEHERPPQQPVRCREREIDVRGAADLDGVEGVAAEHPGRQPRGHRERIPVLPGEAQLAGAVGGRPVRAQPDPGGTLIAGVAAADHRDPVAVAVHDDTCFCSRWSLARATFSTTSRMCGRQAPVMPRCPRPRWSAATPELQGSGPVK
jgi:hypothetical protein